MSDQVKIVEVKEQPIAVMKVRTKQSDLSKVVPDLCGKVWNFLRDHKEIKSNGRMIATYRGSDVNDMQVEVGAQVDEPFESEGPVVCSFTPAGQAAMMTHVGSYSELRNAFAKVFAFCHESNLKTGICWEVYHHPEPPPAPAKTDIFVFLQQ